MFVRKTDEGREVLDRYFELRLTEGLRDALLEILNGKKVHVGKRDEIRRRVMLAQEFSLPDVSIRWDEAEARAAKRGSSMVDLIWDERPRRKAA